MAPMKTKPEVPHAKTQTKTEVKEEKVAPVEALNPNALRPLYEALLDCRDSVLNNDAILRRVDAALSLATSK